MPRWTPLILLLPTLWLTGCDMLGIESASAIAARREADGKAVGAGCRYSGRSIEDCYELNPKADRAAVFAGWREMNDYMTENKIPVQPPAQVAAHDDDEDDEEEAAPPAKKGRKAGSPRGG